MSEKSRVRNEIGRYAIVPLWLIERCHEPQALRLYALLTAKYGNPEHRAWATYSKLSKDLRVSTKSIERSVLYLRQLGALSTERRCDTKGALLGLDYLIHQVPPPDTGVCQDSPLNDTGVATPPTPVSVSNKEDPDKKDPDKNSTASSAFSDRIKALSVKAPRSIRTKKAPRQDRHASHVYCGDRFCVTDKAQESFRKALGSAADEWDAKAWYREMEGELGDGPANVWDILWAKFRQMVKDEFGGDQ